MYTTKIFTRKGNTYEEKNTVNVFNGYVSMHN